MRRSRLAGLGGSVEQSAGRTGGQTSASPESMRGWRWAGRLSAGQEPAPPCGEHGAAVEHCRKAGFSKDRDAGARLPVFGLECEKPFGRTCPFTAVDVLGAAGIGHEADEMFNRLLAQKITAAPCIDSGEDERLDLMKNHKGMESWIGVVAFESFDDLRLTLIAGRLR